MTHFMKSNSGVHVSLQFCMPQWGVYRELWLKLAALLKLQAAVPLFHLNNRCLFTHGSELIQSKIKTLTGWICALGPQLPLLNRP